MTGAIKWMAFVAMVLAAYGVAWLKAYNLSSDYFDYANQQYEQGYRVEALKGMNKLELRREERYLGGYQQVVETWEGAMLGPKPAFYEQAQARVDAILPTLTTAELLAFIETYVELDMRYVPEAADQLRHMAGSQGNQVLFEEMDDFLQEAFPTYYQEEIGYQQPIGSQQQIEMRSKTL